MILSKFKRTFLWFVLLVVLIIWATPYLLHIDKIQQRIDSTLERCYRIDIEVGSFHFSWLPRPHISLVSTTLSNELFTAEVADIDIYPELKMPWQEADGIGRITLKQPKVTLFTWPDNDNKAALNLPGQLPAMNIVIKNGRLSLPAVSGGAYSLAPLFFTEITASFTSEDDKIRGIWQSRSSIAGDMRLHGYVTLGGGGEIHAEIKDFILANILLSKEHEFFRPGEKQVDFALSAFWQHQNGDLHFSGQFPDFFLQRLGNSQHIVPTTADARIRHTDEILSLKINDLQLTEPIGQLSGEIGRFGLGSNADYLIDLHGKDLNMTAVRSHILALIGDSHITELVCDIVRNGTATSAHYYFKDPVERFQEVSAMTIKVDVKDAWIHLAALPLDLAKASGPIIIKDGELTGKNITTSVGNSYGSEGSFLVGLADDKHGLEVDILIDADLSELPTTLRQLIPAEQVVRELASVEGSGRATARLQINGTLETYSTTVDVYTYDQAIVRYGRLSWPMTIQGGDLQVTENSATWQGMAGTVGLHQLEETSGLIAWDQPDIPFAVTSFQGRIDLNTMYNELTSHPYLQQFIAPVLTTIQGSSEVNGALNGGFFHAEDWIYNASLSLQAVALTSTYFNKQIRLSDSQATISDKLLTLSSANIDLLDEPFGLKIALQHRRWQNYMGEITFDGWLKEHHLDWLRTRHFLPQQLKIIVPARLIDFHINWNHEQTSLIGTVANSSESTKAILDATYEKRKLSGSLTMLNGEDTALFSGTLIPSSNTYDIHFKGNFQDKAIDSLIHNKPFAFATMSGDFQLKTWPDHRNRKQHFKFNGNLDSKEIQLFWGEKKIPLTLSSLALQGKGGALQINSLALLFEDNALLTKGKFSTTPGNGHFNVKISSGSALTSEVVEKFIDGYFYHFPKDPDKKALVMDLSGDIGFSLSHFTAPLGNNRQDAKAYILPFSPLKGVYSFAPRQSSLSLDKTQLCGMFVDGYWNWHGEQASEKYLHFNSSPDQPLNFKDFLTCLNFDAVIDGPLEIEGEIATSKEICKQGTITLKSEKGTIKKMVSLAKVLSLINITGLTGAIWHDGFYYHSFEITGTMCDNVFAIEKAFIDGDGVNIIAQGQIDFNKQQLDLTFFVVPFATINNVVTTVPLVGRLLGGKQKRLISVPVKVRGSFSDPQVQVLSASAISKATGQWILDTIVFPFDWAIPDKEKTKSNETEQDIKEIPSQHPEGKPTP